MWKRFRRGTAIGTLALFLVWVIIMSVMMLAIPECREKGEHLIIDGVAVGWLMSLAKLIKFANHRGRCFAPVFNWVCLARLVLSTETKLGLLGGFLLAIAHTTWHCLMK